MRAWQQPAVVYVSMRTGQHPMISDRLYSVPELSRLIGHRPEYVRSLIERGILKAVRPESPDGRPGQWRVLPESIRAWLGVRAPASKRRGESELSVYAARRQRPSQPLRDLA